jgi:hypothetical protein
VSHLSLHSFQHISEIAIDNKNEADSLLQENILLKKKHQQEIDIMKLCHRESMTHLRNNYSSFQQPKEQQLNDANSLMKGIHEMHSELVDEVANDQRFKCHLTKETVKLRQHAAGMLTSLHRGRFISKISQMNRETSKCGYKNLKIKLCSMRQLLITCVTKFYNTRRSTRTS